MCGNSIIPSGDSPCLSFYEFAKLILPYLRGCSLSECLTRVFKTAKQRNVLSVRLSSRFSYILVLFIFVNLHSKSRAAVILPAPASKVYLVFILFPREIAQPVPVPMPAVKASFCISEVHWTVPPSASGKDIIHIAVEIETFDEVTMPVTLLTLTE